MQIKGKHLDTHMDTHAHTLRYTFKVVEVKAGCRANNEEVVAQRGTSLSCHKCSSAVALWTNSRNHVNQDIFLTYKKKRLQFFHYIWSLFMIP